MYNVLRVKIAKNLTEWAFSQQDKVKESYVVSFHSRIFRSKGIPSKVCVRDNYILTVFSEKQGSRKP